MKKGIKLLFIAEILQVAAVVIGFLPLTGTLSAICSIAGLVVFIVGLVQCKKLSEKFGKAIKFYVWAIVTAVLSVIVTFVLTIILAVGSDGSEESILAITAIVTLIATIIAAISSLLELAGNMNVIKGTIEAVPEEAGFGQTTKTVYLVAILVAIVASIVAAFVPGLAFVANILQIAAYVMIVIFLGKAAKHC